jgi:hypothetical protein
MFTNDPGTVCVKQGSTSPGATALSLRGSTKRSSRSAIPIPTDSGLAPGARILRIVVVKLDDDRQHDAERVEENYLLGG